MSEPSLADLFEAAYAPPDPWFPASRQAPMKSHLMKYAQALGCADLKSCPSTGYHRPDDDVRACLLRSLDKTLQPRSVKNLCNDVLALLHAGVSRGWLASPPSPLHEWRSHGKSHLTHGRYRRGIYPPGAQTRFILKPLPDMLSQELESYLAWCQAPDHQAKGRSWKIRKRVVTADNTRQRVGRIAGYAVNIEQLPAELLTLRDLCDPAFLKRFADWWLERRQKSTEGIRDYLKVMHTIVKHQLKDAAMDEGMKALFADLLPAEAVHDKEERWLDLEEIDLIGQSRDPFNPKRVAEDHSPWMRWFLQHRSDPETFSVERRYGRITTNTRLDQHGKPYGLMTLKHYAVWAELSLMLRLWCHRPLRSRNIRELSVKQNLIPQVNGGYLMVFRGDELKVGRRGKYLNRWEAHFPNALLEGLDEWLHFWRPKVIPSPDYPYLFCNSRGRPYRTALLTGLIEATSWEYTQGRIGGAVAMNPHQIRSLWGSQMAIAGLNLIDIARLMGDTVQMVYEQYFLTQRKRIVSQWTKDLAKAIGEGTD
jgi:hypothetical protein